MIVDFIELEGSTLESVEVRDKEIIFTTCEDGVYKLEETGTATWNSWLLCSKRSLKDLVGYKITSAIEGPYQPILQQHVIIQTTKSMANIYYHSGRFLFMGKQQDTLDNPATSAFSDEWHEDYASRGADTRADGGL